MKNNAVLSLAQALLIIGLAFALPVLLSPRIFNEHSDEVSNLNLITAWLGLSHFVFAYKGAFKGLKVFKNSNKALYFLSLALSVLFLFLVKDYLGSKIFNLVVWIAFIPHFIHAESLFLGYKKSEGILYPFPTIAFAYFTLSLFIGDYFKLNTFVHFYGGLLIGLWGLYLLMTQKREIASALNILGFIFIAEGLLWGRYYPYMTQEFQYGVYAFHVAGASVYHYLRSYQFSLNRMAEYKKALMTYAIINAVILVVGCLSHYLNVSKLLFFFSYENFTIWVALHLIMSEVFKLLKSR